MSTAPTDPWHGVSMGSFHVGDQGYKPSLQGTGSCQSVLRPGPAKQGRSSTGKCAAELGGEGWSHAGPSVP